MLANCTLKPRQNAFPDSFSLWSGNKYEKALVDEINRYRLMHGAAQLRVNADLDEKARLWALKMASEDREFLDVNSKYGQLTFSGTSCCQD